MNRPVAFDAAMTTSTQERKNEVRLVALWPFIIAVAILAVVALISDSSLTLDERMQLLQQSGVYP
jgi:anti-sigma-K factor RskA